MKTTPALLLSLALVSAASPVLATGKAPAGDWLSSLEAATRAAEKRQAYILVDLFADWCGWCKTLEREVFPSPAFQEVAKDFVLLRIDTEDQGEGAALQARYQAFSLPTTLILDHRMVKIGEIRGYLPTREFVGAIKEQIGAWDRLVGAYPELLKSKNVDLMREVAEEFHLRGDGFHAAGIYERLLATVKSQTRAAAWLNYVLADAYRLDRNFDKARAAAAAASAVVAALEQEAELKEQIDLLPYYIAHDAGNCRGAVDSLQRFLASHPKSDQRRRLERTLTTLKNDSTCA